MLGGVRVTTTAARRTARGISFTIVLSCTAGAPSRRSPRTGRGAAQPAAAGACLLARLLALAGHGRRASAC
eukprot:scaffold2611_cov356-Prasinococcus_capsulatus_cf.AAC.5